MQILHEKWTAQPRLRPIMCSPPLAELGERLRGGNVGPGVSREDPQHDEHDDRYARDGQRTKGETTDNIAVHGRGARSSRGLRMYQSCWASFMSRAVPYTLEIEGLYASWHRHAMYYAPDHPRRACGA